MRFAGRVLIAALMVAPLAGVSRADETVSIGGSNAVLIKPNAPRASVILMPGGNGAISAGDHGEIRSLKGNQLVRTRHSYASRGLAVLVVDAAKRSFSRRARSACKPLLSMHGSDARHVADESTNAVTSLLNIG